MKKFISIISAVCIALSLAGCSGNTSSDSGADSNAVEQQTRPDDCEPGNRAVASASIMGTENGYYTCRYDYLTSMMELCYYDNNSEKAIYLCAKPECAHDGGEFCTATDTDIRVEFVTKSGEYIYISGTEYSAGSDELQWKLYRASLDGTEFSEMCTFQRVKNIDRSEGNITSSNTFIHADPDAPDVYCNSGMYLYDLIVHRGYAIVPFDDYDYPTVMYSCMPNIMVIDLESGQYKRLPELDYDITKIQSGKNSLYAEGDYLYYCIEPANLRNTKHLYRYHLSSGETELLGTSPRLADFAVMEGVVYYTTCRTENQPDVMMYAYDTATGEEKDLSDKLILDGVRYSYPEILSDGRYLYISDRYATHFDKEKGKTYIIMAGDGDIVVRFTKPEQLYGLDSELKISGGKAYFVAEIQHPAQEDEIPSTSSVAWCCPVEDIINGAPTWTQAFDFYEFNDSRISE